VNFCFVIPPKKRSHDKLDLHHKHPSMKKFKLRSIFIFCVIVLSVFAILYYKSSTKSFIPVESQKNSTHILRSCLKIENKITMQTSCGRKEASLLYNYLKTTGDFS
jgi:hypothetical protein